MPIMNRKRRTRAHVIADLSVNHVEKQVLLCGWTVQRLIPDYGTDLVMTTFNGRGEIENGLVRFQLKATDFLKVTANAISVRIEWRDMIYWLNEQLPVILVIYDAKADRAWWVHLNEVLRDEPALTATFTVHVPLGNVLNPEAIRQIRELRNAAVPARKRES